MGLMFFGIMSIRHSEIWCNGYKSKFYSTETHYVENKKLDFRHNEHSALWEFGVMTIRRNGIWRNENSM